MSKKKILAGAAFGLLFAALLAFFWPTFAHPPRSDFWPFFHHLHRFQELPAWERTFSVINYDVCGHGTYRPLFHVILYWLFLLFRNNFAWAHVSAFAFYCLNIVLLYRLARKFGASRGGCLAVLGVFAFLFSHFDILAWMFHLAVLMGLSFVVLGFLLYLGYLRNLRPCRLAGAMLLFLPGLLCYEVFLPWPAAVLILLANARTKGMPREQLRKAGRASAVGLLALYLAYGSLIALIRAESPVAGLASAPANFFSPSSISFSLAVTAAGTAWSGITAFDPLFIAPGLIHDNICRGGIMLGLSPVLRDYLKTGHQSGQGTPLELPKGISLESLWLETEPTINLVLAVVGGLILLGLALGLFWIWKKKRWKESWPFIFVGFLLLSGGLVLYHGRGATNPPIYILLEFRYQYIPDAVLALLGILVFERLFRKLPRLKPALFLILGLSLVLNLLVTSGHLRALDRQIYPLQRVLEAIEEGLESGKINREASICLPDTLAESLPRLCWNRSLAGFMTGSYQWIFSPEQAPVFVSEPSAAAWKIDQDSLTLTPTQAD